MVAACVWRWRARDAAWGPKHSPAEPGFSSQKVIFVSPWAEMVASNEARVTG
jgi:hypothetical protein